MRSKTFGLVLLAIALSFTASSFLVSVYAPSTYDLDDDGDVDIQDIAMAALAFGSYLGHPRWNSNADFNGDDKIDIKDITTIAMHFGDT